MLRNAAMSGLSTRARAARVIGSARNGGAGVNNGWGRALQDAVLSGSVAAGTTAATVALAGARDSGSAIAPLNATSHIAWGESAGSVADVDAKHTLVGAALHVGACVFWAAFFEKFFARGAVRGNVGQALLG